MAQGLAAEGRLRGSFSHLPAAFSHGSSCLQGGNFSLLNPVPSLSHTQTDLLGQAEGSNAQGPETAQHGEDCQAKVVVG